MSRLRTPLCDLLGIEYPILQAGFGSGAGPDIAGAVSNAGGFGVLGGSGQDSDTIRWLIARTRELTEHPFGINFIIAEAEEPSPPREDMDFLHEQVKTAAESGVPVVLFWGPASPFVAHTRDAGIKLLIQVGSVDEAQRAAADGVDAVIAQGVEAGGHVRGTTSIWELLPAVVEAIAPTPALASGGIGNGAGVARALDLGAQGVSLGTRFVASEEAWAHPAYKQRLVAARAEDAVLSDLYHEWWPDAPHRILRNKLFDEWDAAGRPPPGQRPGEGTAVGTRRTWRGELFDWPLYAIGVITPEFEGDFDRAPMWAGESVAVVNNVKPAGEIVRDLVRDAERMLS